VKLGDPDVVSNPSEYQKLAQSVAELDEVYPISLLSLFFKKKIITPYFLLNYDTLLYFVWIIRWFQFLRDSRIVKRC